MSTGILDPHVRLGRLFRPGQVASWIETAGEGERCNSREQAERQAESIAGSPRLDAAVVQDSDGAYWVFPIAEITQQRGVGSTVADLRGAIRGINGPDGVRLQSVLASRDATKAAVVEKITTESAQATLELIQVNVMRARLARLGLRVPDQLNAEGLSALRGELLSRVDPAFSEIDDLSHVLLAIDASLEQIDQHHSTIRFDELAAAATEPSDDLRGADIVQGLLQDPDRVAGLTAAINRLLVRLDHVRRKLRTGGLSSRTADVVRAEMRDLELALGRDDYLDAGMDLQVLSQALAIASSDDLPEFAREDLDAMRIAVSDLCGALSAPPIQGSRALEHARRLFMGFKLQTQMILDAVAADPYRAWVSNDGRLRPLDAADAMLRTQIALWSVLRDARGGKLSDHTNAEQMFDLAMERIEGGELDYKGLARSMSRDPEWFLSPPQVPTPDGSLEPLSFDLTGSLTNVIFQRSIESAIASSHATSVVNRYPVVRAARDGAVAMANGADDHVDVNSARAVLNTAYALHFGASYLGAEETFPPNASQVPAAVVFVCGLDPPTDLERGVPALVDAAWEKIETGDLDGLGDPALRQLKAMLGPKNDHGASLVARITSERAEAISRAKSSDTRDLVLTSIASMGVSGWAMKGAMALTGTTRGAYAIWATSGGLFFSGANQMRATGEMTLEKTVMDVSLFYMLGGLMGAVSKGATLVIPGTSRVAGAARVGLTAGVGIPTLGGAMTGIEALLDERVRDARTLRERFVEHTKMAALLYGVGMGFAAIRPDLTPQLASRWKELETRALEAQRELGDSFVDLRGIIQAVEQHGEKPGAARDALVDRILVASEHMDVANRKAEQATQSFLKLLKEDFPSRYQRIAAKLDKGEVEIDWGAIQNALDGVSLDQVRFELGLMRRLSAELHVKGLPRQVSRSNMADLMIDTWLHSGREDALEAGLEARHVESGSYVPTGLVNRSVLQQRLQSLTRPRSKTLTEPQQKAIEALQREVGVAEKQGREWMAPSRKLDAHIDSLLGLDPQFARSVRQALPCSYVARAVHQIAAMGYRFAKNSPVLKAVQERGSGSADSWILDPLVLREVEVVAAKVLPKGTYRPERIIPREMLADALSPEIMTTKLERALDAQGIDVAKARQLLQRARETGRSWAEARDFVESVYRELWRDIPSPKRHDFDEYAPLGLLRRVVARAEQRGEEVPVEVRRMIQSAEREGNSYVAVGKDQRIVLRGLAHRGAADPWANIVHGLAKHHAKHGSVPQMLDIIDALRTERIYKKAWSDGQITQYFVHLFRNGQINRADFANFREARTLYQQRYAH